MLARTRTKGWGLFAARAIPKGHDLAYFRMLVHDARRFNTRRFVEHEDEPVFVRDSGEVETAEHGPKRVLWRGGKRPGPGRRFVDALQEGGDWVLLDDGSAFRNPLLNANNSYTMQVYDQYERRLRPDLIMDVFGRSHGVDRATGVPYWGHFANEPPPGSGRTRGSSRCATRGGATPAAGGRHRGQAGLAPPDPPGRGGGGSYGAQYDRPYDSGEHRASMLRAVAVEGRRVRDGEEQCRVRWSDGKRTWEPVAKLVNEEAVALLEEA